METLRTIPELKSLGRNADNMKPMQSRSQGCYDMADTHIPALVFFVCYKPKPVLEVLLQLFLELRAEVIEGSLETLCKPQSK